MKDSTDIINRKLKIFQLRYKVLKDSADILNRKKKERIKKMSKYSNAKKNYCVFTPKEVANLMCKLCNVNKDV